MVTKKPSSICVVDAAFERNWNVIARQLLKYRKKVKREHPDREATYTVWMFWHAGVSEVLDRIEKKLPSGVKFFRADSFGQPDPRLFEVMNLPDESVGQRGERVFGAHLVTGSV